MADPGRPDLDQHLSIFGAVELNLLYLERLTGLKSDSSASLHGLLPGFEFTRAGLTQRGLSHLHPAIDKSRRGFLVCAAGSMRIKRTTHGETVAREEGCGCRSHTSAWVFCWRSSRFALPWRAMSRAGKVTFRKALFATLPRPERTRSGRACSASSAAKPPASITIVIP